MDHFSEEDVSNILADIGTIFHDHATTLLTLLQALTPIIETMSPNPFGRKNEPSPDFVDRVLAKPVSQLRESLGALILSINDDWEARGVNVEVWKELNKRFEQFRSYNESVRPIAHRPPFLRQSARELIKSIKKMNSANLFKEIVEKVINDAKEIERIVCLYELSVARARIIAMDQQAQTLRDYLTERARPKEEPTVLRIRAVIKQVMRNLEEFANQKGIEFRDISHEDALVEVVERDIRRALSNLLHNAIKYSWKMPGNERAWINIRCYAQHSDVFVEIENWGVPIEKDEIEEKLIFQLGYRGALASDRARSGTGIGLYDALKTAKEHGGDILIKSEPARRYERPGYGKQPYITTVKLKLPIYIDDENMPQA